MRHAKRFLVALAALATVLLARPALAQTHRPFDLGVSGGASLVSGADRDFYDVGYNGGLSALLPLRTLGFTLRADAAYLGVPGKNRSTQTYPGGPDTLLIGDLTIMAGTLSAQFESGGRRSVRPYATVGGGVYRVESEGVLYGQHVSGADTKFGVLGGVGLTFPVVGRRAFVEARVHNVFADGGSSRVYPISLGLIF